MGWGKTSWEAPDDVVSLSDDKYKAIIVYGETQVRDETIQTPAIQSSSCSCVNYNYSQLYPFQKELKCSAYVLFLLVMF